MSIVSWGLFGGGLATLHDTPGKPRAPDLPDNRHDDAYHAYDRTHRSARHGQESCAKQDHGANSAEDGDQQRDTTGEEYGGSYIGDPAQSFHLRYLQTHTDYRGNGHF